MGHTMANSSLCSFAAAISILTQSKQHYTHQLPTERDMGELKGIRKVPGTTHCSSLAAWEVTTEANL